MPLTDMPDTDPVDDVVPDDPVDDADQPEPPDTVEVEEETDEPETPEAASSDDDDDQPRTGKRAQKRIDKLTARWRSAQEDLEQQREQNRQLAERLERLEQAQQQTRQTDEKAELQRKLAEAKARRKQAFEDGDADAEEAAFDELLDLRLKLSQQASEPKPTAPKPQPSAPRVPKAEQEWQARNAWFTDPAKQSAQAVAGALYQALLAESRSGAFEHDPEDSEFYDELDTRLQAALPQLREQAAPPPTPARKGNGPVAGGSRGVSPNASPKSSRLTKADLTSMARYGLDPNDPEHRRDWLVLGKRGEL